MRSFGPGRWPASRVRAGLAALITAVPSITGLAADTAIPAAPSAVQMIADVTLIDHDCGNLVVNFGRAFRAGASDGVRAIDVLPAGELRSAFEDATRTRLTQTSRTELCGPLATRYAADLPGLFILP